MSPRTGTARGGAAWVREADARLLRWLVPTFAAWVAACSPGKGGSEGGLTVVVTSELAVPQDIDRLELRVQEGGREVARETFAMKDENRFPLTVLRLASGERERTVTVTVEAYRAPHTRVVERRSRTTVPTGRKAVLVIELEWLCSTLSEQTPTCDADDTCAAGTCGSPDVEPSALTTEAAGGPLGDFASQCFDAIGCFRDAVVGEPGVTSAGPCTLARPGTERGLNVAVALPPGSGGVCTASRCLVLLNGFAPETGWTVEGDDLVLPPSLCERLTANSEAKLLVSRTCPTKTRSVLPCPGEVATPTPEADAAEVASPDAAAPPDAPPPDARPPDPARLELTPAAFDFGAVVAATTSPTRAFTVTNRGELASGVPGATLEGPGRAAFELAPGSTCTNALGPGASCAVSVRFTPAVVTTTAASLVVTATPGGRASAALTGTGVQPAALAATPTALTFAGRLLATASAAQGVALRNGGALASGAVMARLEGSHPGDFAVTSSCGVLGASGMCTLDVTFRPTARGTRTATLRLEANPGGAAFVNLVGEGLAPATLIASPASLSFGALPVGSSHGGLTARISNTGDAPSGGLMLVRGGTHAGDFAISPATTCGPALAGGGSCDVALTFSPTNTGARGASLVVSSAPGGMVTLPLSGTGLQPARLAVAPAALTFAERLEGSTSGALQVAVSNLGDAATGVPAVTLGGSHPDDFSISSGCTAPVLPAASCTVGVTFTPRAAGARGATLAVSASPGGTATVALSGSGRQTEVAYASGLFGSVALHPDGTTLYFADWATGQIFRGDTSGGARVLLAGTGITDFRGLCLSQVGNPTYLYAMANPHGRLMRVTMASGFVDEIFPSPPIAAPHACVVSHDGGTLYVGDTITQRVYSMPAPGGATVVHTEPFGVPVQMLLDKSGSTIYATNDTPYVYRFPSGTPGTAPVLLNPGGGLTKSTGIALSADEQRLFVADDAGFVSALPARLVWLPSAGGTATPFFTASTALRSPVFMVMEPSGERLWVGDPGHLGTPGVHVFALPLSLR